MTDEQAVPPERWAIVEIMGHHKLAGRVSEEEMFGVKMLRVDVPDTVSLPRWNEEGGRPQAGYTKYFGASAIFGIEICSEGVARRVATETEASNHPLPYQPKALPAATELPYDGEYSDAEDIIDPDNIPEGPDEDSGPQEHVFISKELLKRLDEEGRDVMTDEEVARVAHEVNRAYCTALHDFSQPDWSQAPEWQRSSAIAGVRFHRANPLASAAASHESWLAEKERDGWRYGPVKDPEKKEHPCYVPFAELPQAQQAKDFIFRAIVHALTEDLT